MIFAQLLANGIIAGSVYALIASGFSLIYATNRFVHFAHGTVVAAGAYIMYTMFSLLGLNFYVAAFFAIILTALLGALVYSIVYRPLQKHKSSNAILLIAGLGLFILMENLLVLLFGADVQTIDYITVSKGIDVLGAVVTPLQMIIVATSIALLIILGIFIKYTKWGKIIRAVADNDELADTTGINTAKVQVVGFGIGSALAGVAGILIGLEQNLEPTMGTHLMIKGFAGAIIGGVTSIPGSVLGSYLLGIVENFGVWYLPSGYKDAIAFVLLLVFLIVRPNGILGVNKGVRE